MNAAIARLSRRYERVLRYILAGGAVTLFYSLLTVGLVSGHVENDPTLASAIGSVLTVPVSFLVHRAVTYVDVAFDHAQWRRFGVISLASFVIATSVMKAVDLLHWPYWIGLAIGWVLIPVVNYTINAVWVFRAKAFLALHRENPAPIASESDRV